MNYFYRKSVCTVITTVFTAVQLLAYAPAVSADTFTDYATEGKQYGKDSRNWFLNNLPSLNGKTMTIKGQNGQTVTIDNTDEMSGGNSSSSSQYPVETTAEDMEDLKSMAGDSKTQQEKAAERKDYVMGTIQKLVQGDSEAQVTIENTVYSIIDDLAASKQPDYTEDAMWQMTRSILENLTEHTADLATCDSETSKITKDEVVHIPNIVTCQQVLDRSGECELEHDYGIADVVTHVSGPMNIGQCKNQNTGEITPYCVRIWAGTLGFHTQGSGTVRTSVKFAVKNMNAITSAKLVYMSTEDEGQAFFGPVGDLKQYYYRYSYRDCSQWDPWGYFKPINCGHEYSFSRDREAGSYFQNQTGTLDFLWDIKSRPEGTVFDFTVNNYVPSGHGGGYGAMEITFDPQMISADHDSWGPTSCMDIANGITDGVAEGTFTCVEMPSLDSSGCYIEGMMPICEDMVNPSPFTDISPLCKKVRVSGNFNFYKGDTGCWQGYMGSDEQGNPIYEEVCGGENVGGNLDTCTEYEEQGCTFLGSECTDGMTGASGNCYVADVTYDCGTDEITSKTTVETDYTCTGIRCLGTECAEASETKSTDFAKVNAMMNMIDYASQDMECVGTDDDGYISGTANVTCEVFKGEKGSCKIAVGGWQNCCKENASTPSQHAYLKTIRNVANAKAAQNGITNWTHQPGSVRWMDDVGELRESIDGVAGDIVDGAFDTAFNIGGAMLWHFAGQYASFINKDLGVAMDYAQTAYAVGKLIPETVYETAFTTITDNLPNIFNDAMSWAKDLFSPVKELMNYIVDKIKGYLKELLTEFLQKLGIESAAAGGTTGTAGATAMEGAMGAAVAVVGYVYMAYMVAKMIVSLVYACEEEEMEMVSKRANNSCHYVGSYCEDKVLGVCIMKKKVYCCFQSPLGRIINEQIRLQYDEVEQEDGTKVRVPRIQDWGGAKNPMCDGISVEDMNKIDWDAIDLSEWTHILETNNLSMEQEKANTMENLTGKAEAIR